MTDREIGFRRSRSVASIQSFSAIVQPSNAVCAPAPIEKRFVKTCSPFFPAHNRTDMNFNSSLFDRIRIKPSCEEPRETEALCERPGCSAGGVHRAPKGRGKEGQYWRFCLDHVREYNHSYNY